MAKRGNGTGRAGIDDSRTIAAAAADAVAEHEYWLQALHKALICGLDPGDAVLRDDAHLACRFGRWLVQHRGAGLLDGDLFDVLEQSHAEIHETGRALASRAAAGAPIAAEDYESFLVAVNGFRQVAIEVETVHGGPEDKPGEDDESLSALTGRLTMLNELERERDRAIRTAMPLCFALVRPQGVAGIEEEYGRVGVDRAVIGMAARLFAQLRPYDAVYRYGPAEFLLCLPNTASDQALTVARRLAAAIGDSPLPLSEKVTVTLQARFGIAAVDPRCPVQETVDRAVCAIESIADTANAAVGDRIAVWSPAS